MALFSQTRDPLTALKARTTDEPLPVDPSEFRFSRRNSLLNRRSGHPSTAFDNWRGPLRERWTFVSPHDDDALIAQGRLIQYATAQGTKVRIVIVTDGREGWVRKRDEDHIVETRKGETERAYRWLGVEPRDITRLEIPDMEVINRTGPLQKALMNIFMDEQCTRIFYPWQGDPHIDHQATALSTAIGQFHAGGGLQGDGQSLPGPVHTYQTPVYIPAVTDYITARLLRPDIQIEAPLAAQFNYLRAIGEYVSQEQIAGLITARAQGGPIEHLYIDKYPAYDANEVRRHFERGSALTGFTLFGREWIRRGREKAAWDAVAQAALERSEGK